MVTDFCGRIINNVGDFLRYVGDILTNILNRSPTSQTCQQHIWSPTSVTNIDVINNFAYKTQSELTARAVNNSMKNQAKHPFEATNA